MRTPSCKSIFICKRMGVENYFRQEISYFSIPTTDSDRSVVTEHLKRNPGLRINVVKLA